MPSLLATPSLQTPAQLAGSFIPSHGNGPAASFHVALPTEFFLAVSEDPLTDRVHPFDAPSADSRVARVRCRAGGAAV